MVQQTLPFRRLHVSFMHPDVFDPVPWLGCAELVMLSSACSAARRRVLDEWLRWQRSLCECDFAFLELSLCRFWRRHGAAITEKGARVNRTQSAGEMYECWPSHTFFGGSPLPWKDRLDFERGDSSYNLWIFDIQVALQCLDRIIADLYLRMQWPNAGSPEACQWSTAASASTECEFVALASAAARNAAAAGARRARRDEEGTVGFTDQDSDGDFQALFFNNWELRLRPVRELMEQIWWRDGRGSGIWDPSFQDAAVRRPWIRDGQLLPQRPQPEQGLSLLKGQESVFITADRFELWVYACYVD
eukprot:TRINITY_DN40487_c0_g1_i1.p1 TRINITY_DN40487_c0_g1~~TRINITY_DN40487_c0_g1_i1.p1  ORF type:complete len:304 (-),score=30.40 TRINITY_DN40487_c0_g1_i1:236-1147(-)